MMHYGATPDEWAFWDLAEGLTEDLLPVVCKPNGTIHPNSNLKQYGKVPSRYTGSSEIVGFTNWTTHVATDRDLDVWRHQGDYGICLQTRRVRALDFDILDSDYARYIQDCLDLIGYAFPYRTRANSSKFLTLFYLEGDYGKQVLNCGSFGIIELLMGGQQCVVAGTHPSGCRYQWDWRHPIPTFNHAQFEALLFDLAGMVSPDRDGRTVSWSNPSRSRVVDRRDVGEWVEDPVADFLRSAGLALRETSDGRVYVRCPWIDGHSTSSDCTESCWFSAGTNGFDAGHYRCLHASCHDRSDDQFRRAIGYDAAGFESIGPPVERACSFGSSTDVGRVDRDDQDFTRVTTGELPERSQGESRPESPALSSQQSVLEALDAHVEPRTRMDVSGVTHPLDMPRFTRVKGGIIKTTFDNVVKAIERPDLVETVVGRDEFKDELVMLPWKKGEPFTYEQGTFHQPGVRLFRDSDYDRLRLLLSRMGFGPGDIPVDHIRRAINKIADDQSFDSAVTWLNTIPPWDGVLRIDTFCSRYLGSEDSPYTRAVGRYWWTAHAGRVLTPGIQADMAVVLISEQGTGKTSSLRSLVEKEDHYVELGFTGEHDVDLSRMMRGKLIGEMAELKGVRNRDVESLKAWISRRHELWIPKYSEFSRAFPRRLVLVGTSNEDEFLNDETGNRRWLPLMVGKQDVKGILRDRVQLWAEACELYLYDGIMWNDAERLAREVHVNHMTHDEWQLMIQDWLHDDDGFEGVPGGRDYLTVHDVARHALDMTKRDVNPHVQKRIGAILRKLGYVKSRKRIDGKHCKVWALLKNT